MLVRWGSVLLVFEEMHASVVAIWTDKLIMSEVNKLFDEYNYVFVEPYLYL